jgi:hypothetical protein
MFLKVLSGILPLTEATSSVVSWDKEGANNQPKEGSDLAEDESDSMHIDYPPRPPRDPAFNQGAARNVTLDLAMQVFNSIVRHIIRSTSTGQHKCHSFKAGAQM